MIRAFSRGTWHLRQQPIRVVLNVSPSPRRASDRPAGRRGRGALRRVLLDATVYCCVIVKRSKTLPAAWGFTGRPPTALQSRACSSSAATSFALKNSTGNRVPQSQKLQLAFTATGFPPCPARTIGAIRNASRRGRTRCDPPAGGRTHDAVTLVLDGGVDLHGVDVGDRLFTQETPRGDGQPPHRPHGNPAGYTYRTAKSRTWTVPRVPMAGIGVPGATCPPAMKRGRPFCSQCHPKSVWRSTRTYVRDTIRSSIGHLPPKRAGL